MRWLRNLLAGRRGCAHKRTRGVATYYESDLRIYLRLVQCEDCGITIITEV